MGRGQRVLQIIRLNTLVGVIRVRTSCEYLLIDTNFVSILLLISVLFSWTPYLLLIGGRYHGGEELKWRHLAHYQLMSKQGPNFCPHSKGKANCKAQISGKLVTSRTSDVATASVHSGKTRLKKLIMIIIISNRKTIY